MMGWGIMLLLVGLGSFILPHITDRQFILVTIFGEHQTLGGIIVSAVGAILIVVGALRAKKNKEG